MTRLALVAALAVAAARPGTAATVRVPDDHKTIQAAIDAAAPGDTVTVAAGTYRERIRLKPGVTLRSEGDDARGAGGLKRAEATVIDGGGAGGTAPGVVTAEGTTLDGFTVTNVGVYDDKLWKTHYDSHGEELGDEEGAVRAEGTTPAVSVRGVSCTVTRCVVRHNGDVGIGVVGGGKSRTLAVITDNLVFRNMGGGIGVAEGAEPVVRGNTCKENLRAGIGCRKANPVITDNECHYNVRAGIGCREGAKPVVRGNKCFKNRRAGIGIRMEGTAPVVESNECYENDMAGIGCRDGAGPVLRDNVCRKNKMAGIGCRDGARPLVVGNDCRENEMVGIGVQTRAEAILLKNRCVGNKLVAVGVTEGATATVIDNDLSRTGGQPPIIAVRDGSTATIRDNRITGGGVAAILVQGKATIGGNTFTGVGEKQGTAVWVWAKSTAAVSDNAFDGYRTAVNANKASVFVSGNRIARFQATAIVVTESETPAHVVGNAATSADPAAKVVDVRGPAGVVADNTLTGVGKK